MKGKGKKVEYSRILVKLRFLVKIGAMSSILRVFLASVEISRPVV